MFETFLLRDGVMCVDDRRVGIAVCVVYIKSSFVVFIVVSRTLEGIT